MGYSNKVHYKNNDRDDIFGDDFNAKSAREYQKKQQCVECGKYFTPAIKIDYCCNQCKIENHEMFSTIMAKYSEPG